MQTFSNKQGSQGKAAASRAGKALAPGRKVTQRKTMPAAAVTQFSGGSSQANEDLIKAMGKAAEFVDKLPGAKPHAKKGTGKGGVGRHQARDARVINKAKQDTAKAHDDPTMFSSSRMRTADASHREKDRRAEEGRSERKAAGKAAKDAEIREYFDLSDDEAITSGHRKEYKKVEEASK